MKERPILFSTAMVQAILAGRKTMTRRVLNPHHVNELRDEKPESVAKRCPYGSPGDWLWIRETFMFSDDCPRVFYKASDWKNNPGGKWKPSIHMPKWAARLWLKVTGVRVERLQDVGDGDALCEGIRIASIDTTPVQEFEDLWDSINAGRGYGWDKNPWVWVVEFERQDPAELERLLEEAS